MSTADGKPDRDGVPMLDSWLSGMATMCAVSLTAIEAYSRLMALESDDCQQPDHRDPEVVVAESDSGDLVFVDDSGHENDVEQAIIVETDDAVVELEGAR